MDCSSVEPTKLVWGGGPAGIDRRARGGRVSGGVPAGGGGRAGRAGGVDAASCWARRPPRPSMGRSSPSGATAGSVPAAAISGRRLRLAEALDHAADRAATDDPRFPPIERSELSQLDVDVWILWGPQPVAARGEDRVAAVVIGRHGVQIARGARPRIALAGRGHRASFRRADLSGTGLPEGRFAPGRLEGGRCRAGGVRGPRDRGPVRNGLARGAAAGRGRRLLSGRSPRECNGRSRACSRRSRRRSRRSLGRA